VGGAGHHLQKEGRKKEERRRKKEGGARRHCQEMEGKWVPNERTKGVTA